jgi:hypothetical protein
LNFGEAQQDNCDRNAEVHISDAGFGKQRSDEDCREVGQFDLW